MKIGKVLKERIELLGLSVEELSSLTFIDIDVLNRLVSDKMDYEEVDSYERALLCDALYCSDNFFIDEKERKRDMICASMNRGSVQDEKTIKAKCRIYRFVKDYLFIDEIINGGNS